MINRMVPIASPFLNYVRRSEALWPLLIPPTRSAAAAPLRHEKMECCGDYLATAVALTLFPGKVHKTRLSPWAVETRTGPLLNN